MFASICNNAKAVQLPTINNRIYTDPITMVPVTVGANTNVDITPKTGAFVDVSVVCKVEFAYDVNYARFVTPPGGATTVDVLLTPYDQFNVAGTPFTHTFSITYDPSNPNPVKDKDLFVINNAWRVDAQITAINGLTTGTLPANMYVDLKLDIDRVYDFISVLTTGPSLAAPTAISIDGITGADEIQLTWTALQGADEYQLEWTFINDYNTTVSGTPISPSVLPFDFRTNATRVTTKELTYRVPLLFDRGWVAFRLRAVGRDMTNPTQILFTDWNNNIPDAPGGSYPNLAAIPTKILVAAHEDNKNWQVTSTFAEEGKKKEVISYFDGSLRNRQTVTRVNTDKDVIVGETVYDYQGRPAVTILPTPVDNNTPGISPSIHYYPFFNTSDVFTGVPYSKKDFDLDDANSCDAGANGLSTSSGTSKYYSPNNPDFSNERSFIPDAKKYPFTQIEYTPDNTGRIRSQGGVGSEFQLGDLTNPHETKYFYGQPNQLQLDRLFGTEVGDAAHYKKNVVIDPNGQSSVSYLDQEGRVVATSLAGDAPVNPDLTPKLDPIPSESAAAVDMLIDLFAKDANGNSSLNTVNISGDAIEFSTQLLVPYAANYTFSYDFNVAPFTDTCLDDSLVCFNCVYNLTLSIKDECGTELVQFGSPAGPIEDMLVGQFTQTTSGPQFQLTCMGNYTMSPSYTQTMALPVGNYTITKTLTINQDALDFYIDAYLDPEINPCIKTLEEFQQSYLDSLDTTSCYIDCEECLANLGSKDDFVANGLGTALEFDVLYEQCVKDCKTMYSPCEAAYEMMLADVTPGGQYAEYLSGSSINPGAFPLSVLNTSNQLPKNLTIFGAITGAGTWRTPQTTLNNTVYNNYINDDGSIAQVEVFPAGTG
ncbi:MAG TPA: hypothetical protein VD905_20150, partial [Flavobacteriales bacterium]|nr:hypothetical protein [Flavobacteriales bacterium]